MIGRAHGLAVCHRLEDGLDAAASIGLDNVGAEFVSDPKVVVDELKPFRIEVGAGEVTLLGALMHDATLALGTAKEIFASDESVMSAPDEPFLIEDRPAIDPDPPYST